MFTVLRLFWIYLILTLNGAIFVFSNILLVYVIDFSNRSYFYEFKSLIVYTVITKKISNKL